MEKEKTHYFTRPAQDSANSQPISTKGKEWGYEKKIKQEKLGIRLNKSKLKLKSYIKLIKAKLN